MSIICEEIFDETSHPSEEEIRDYAAKIGIDPDSEPQLLPLAAEGLMKALPAGWKPCYDDKSKSYYYYNNLTKKTQWEHPLDEIYRDLVKKARTDSQSFSLQENRDKEDQTYITDDILSLDEPPSNVQPKKLEPLLLSNRKKDNVKLSPLKLSPSASPKRELKLFKQRSEDFAIGTKKLSLGFNSFDNDKDMGLEKDGNFDKHPRSLDKSELKLSGGGSMFLKSNTRKSVDSIIPNVTGGKQDSLQDSIHPRSILREKNTMEHSKSVEFDKLSVFEKSEKDDEDKKSVRFNLDNNTDIGITFSDKSSSEDELMNSDKKIDDIINVKLTPHRIPAVAASALNLPLKLIKPNPQDFITPKLTLNKGSDSEEDTKSLDKVLLDNADNFFDSDNESEKINEIARMLGKKAEKKLTNIKQNLWEEKSEELLKFKSDLHRSHKEELKRILEEETVNQEEHIKVDTEKLKLDFDKENENNLENLRQKYKEQLDKRQQEIEATLEEEKTELKKKFDVKKEELEKYYEEKLAETEKELAERVDKNKEELIFNHNANVEQLKQNHGIIIEDLKREFKVEEQILRKQHQSQIAELRAKMQTEMDQEKSKPVCDERQYEKLRCEKRLLEDKYRCLKEKYFRLKSEIKLSIEKRNRRKEQSTTTNTTGSETEQSNSNNKDRISSVNSPPSKILEKPPTPKHVKYPAQEAGGRIKSAEMKNIKQVVIQDLDTSVSDNCYQSDDKANQNDSSDSTNPGRSRKKIFSRLKSSSMSRINNNSNSKSRKPQQRSCSPVENLRRQLQKLEDLEDQFPENPQSDTYHLRYPFSDGGRQFEGSSELEFFRHRIHLERDSIKRAKESLRNQKTLFQQRQKELKLKHGTMARHTLQQLCQEEKELTDMEVNLHRTRSLLGEKVIRLRHLEQSLQRANVQNDPKFHEDATLSDISSHSASSGISSTEFQDGGGGGKVDTRGERFQESSEIIQSLENLNSEIREIWDVLRTQQQQSSIAQAFPPLVYPDLGWPILASTAMAAPPSIPTLADRLHNYRQHAALAQAQSTVVTQHHAAHQGATTTLVERTRSLRHWLRQTGTEAGEGNAPQATL